MARRRRRRVGFRPNFKYFGPDKENSVTELVLKVEELEAVRLKDLEGYTQIEASHKMGVSQPTFSRILGAARRKIAESLVKGGTLRVKGENYNMV